METWTSDGAGRFVFIALTMLVIGLVAFGQANNGAITGQILGRDGAPIGNVRVAAMAADLSGATSALFSISQTDSAGRFRLEAIPAGRYYVVAGPVERPVYHPGQDGTVGATIITVGAAVISGVDFTVDPVQLAPPPPRPIASSRIVPQNCPAGNPAAPAQPLAAMDFVELECDGGPRGSSPKYSVRINANGNVSWKGGPSVAVSGNASAAIDPKQARSLIERYRASGFWSLCDSYPTGQSHNPAVYTTVRIAGQEKRVTNYWNANALAPSWLSDLEWEIDRLSDTHRWIHGDPLVEILNWSTLTSDLFEYIKPGVTPLMKASGQGKVDDVRALLTSGADPNAEDASGLTALMYAGLSNNDAARVKTLLEGGASASARSRAGITPLMAQVILRLSGDPIPALRLLLEAGADINAADSSGKTALMMVIPRSLEVGRLDDEHKTRDHKTRANLAAFLRDNGARGDLRDLAGRTALDLLDEEAARTPGHSNEQYEKLRMIFEQPTGTGKVRIRGTIRPQETALQAITLERAGADPVSVTSVVMANGVVEFPAIAPGVYTVSMEPSPVFPVPVSPVAIPGSDVSNLEIALPAVREVRVNATVQGGGPLPVFWLLLASRMKSTAAPTQPSRLSSVRPVPPNMAAELAAGAQPQLIQLGGPVNKSVAAAVLDTLPVCCSGAQFELKDTDGSFNMTLPEGDYIAAPLLTAPEINVYTMRATADGVDLTSEPLRVSRSGQEIQITFIPVAR